MPNKIASISYGALSLALAAILSATPASAGFQLNSSGGVVQSSAPRGASDMPEVISPIVISGEKQPAQVALPSRAPDVSLSSPSTAPVTLSSAPQPALAPPAPPTSPVDVSNATVRGFALQVPLALALRQLLPVGYSFYIDQDVDMNTLVSYRGGRPWPETLKTMLAPVGLVDQIQGTVVTVSRVPGASSAPPPSAPPAAAVPIAEKSPLLPPPSTTSKTIGQLTVPASSSMRFSEPAPMPNPSPLGGAYGGGEVWSAQRGDTLHKVLVNWCRKANVELQWLSEYDYPLQASSNFNGGFEDAVRGLLSGFENAQPQPVGELHANSSAGQMVLVVQVRGNSHTN